MGGLIKRIRRNVRQGVTGSRKARYTNVRRPDGTYTMMPHDGRGFWSKLWGWFMRAVTRGGTLESW